MKITYGILTDNIDVTQICIKRLKKQNIINIPPLDHARTAYFSDPLPNVLKTIFITTDGNNVTTYDHMKEIYIDTITNQVYTQANVPAYISVLYPSIHAKLATMHRQLRLDYGSFNDEYPEQLMATRYLTGKEKQ